MAVPGRPLRADALRNRDALVAVARTAFSTATRPVPLEDIARAAGVGIGTLYRHFPTREALVEAVYLRRTRRGRLECGHPVERTNTCTGSAGLDAPVRRVLA